jgi:hypothetical protein
MSKLRKQRNNHLTTARRILGLKQYELSKEIGIPNSDYSNYKLF